MDCLQNFHFETFRLAFLCSVMFAFPYSSSKQIHQLGTVLLFLFKHYLTSPKGIALYVALSQDAGIVYNFIKRMLYIILICFPRSMALIL